MPAAGALGMVGVDCAALERRNRIFDETALVEGVGMDCHLHVVALRHAEAIVDRRRRRAPILMQLESHDSRADLLLERLGQAGVALAEQAEVHRQLIERLVHACNMPGSRRAGRSTGAARGPGAAADHGRDPAHERVLDLLRTDEVNMRIDGAGRHDQAFTCDHLAAGAQHDVHPRLYIRIAGLADGCDPPVLDPQVGLDDAPMVENDDIGDHGIDDFGGRALALAHAVANDFAAAEFDLFTVDAVIVLDFDPQLRVAETYPIAAGRAEHLGVGAACDAGHDRAPMMRPWNPYTIRSPARATSSMSRC